MWDNLARLVGDLGATAITVAMSATYKHDMLYAGHDITVGTKKLYKYDFFTKNNTTIWLGTKNLRNGILF